MPQYTIKLNTYDPDIVEAFERLRKSRKQAAFTHEALKYFLASEKGVQVIDLMSHDYLQPSRSAHIDNKVELPQNRVQTEQTVFPEPDSDLSKGYCSDVMEKILK
ncbi:MAG: hypothetical protein HYS23_01470 [Geobacter sp.]|nr:hypothetical protein [Geobacter sp.]